MYKEALSRVRKHHHLTWVRMSIFISKKHQHFALFSVCVCLVCVQDTCPTPTLWYVLTRIHLCQGFIYYFFQVFDIRARCNTLRRCSARSLQSLARSKNSSKFMYRFLYSMAYLMMPKPFRDVNEAVCVVNSDWKFKDWNDFKFIWNKTKLMVMNINDNHFSLEITRKPRQPWTTPWWALPQV